MEDIQKMIDVLNLNDIEYNIKTLVDMSTRIKESIHPLNKNDHFVEDLYKDTIDDDWLKAQCISAINQINKLTDQESTFHKYYDSILTSKDQKLLTQELILDLCYLDIISKYKINFATKIDRANYLTSNSFFLHAKFALFTNKLIPSTTNRDFSIASMPTLIRQSIELKIKNMIGFDKVTKDDGGYKQVTISSILNFFKENPELLDLPLPIEYLIAINRWTNNFVHSGIASFSWQSLEAVDIIECLFSIKDDATNRVNLDGFSYIKRGVLLDDIKTKLDNKFKAVFYLNETSIEGYRK